LKQKEKIERVLKKLNDENYIMLRIGENYRALDNERFLRKIEMEILGTNSIQENSYQDFMAKEHQRFIGKLLRENPELLKQLRKKTEERKKK
jgi:hypothetical protein